MSSHTGRTAQDFVKKLLQNPEAPERETAAALFLAMPCHALPTCQSRAQMLEKYRADVEYVDSKRKGPREIVVSCSPKPETPYPYSLT